MKKFKIMGTKQGFCDFLIIEFKTTLNEAITIFNAMKKYRKTDKMYLVRL